MGGTDLDSLAAAAVHNATVGASSWPKGKGCRRRRWRGGCWGGLSLLQESICIQGLQREFIKVVCGWKEKQKTSSCSTYITTRLPKLLLSLLFKLRNYDKGCSQVAAPSLYLPVIIQVILYYLFSERLYSSKNTDMIN